MKAIKNAKIIALVGMPGSGKGTVIDHIKSKDVPDVYFGGVVLSEMKRRGIERTADNEKEFRKQIRQEKGKDWVVEQVIKETNNLINAGQRHIVLDGVYSWTEYKILKHEFPGEVTFVAVVAPKSLRHHRLSIRRERPFNDAEANDRDWEEIENLEKGGPIAAADYYLDNSGSVETLYAQTDKLLSDIHFFE